MFRTRSQLTFVLALALAAVPSLATADDGIGDRVAFGGDAVVVAGETVQSVAVFGGDAIVAGLVEGDVVSFGGDVELAPSAEVRGSVSVMGGELRAAEGARFERAIDGSPEVVAATLRPADGVGAWIGEVFRQAVAHGLLFLLALLLMGLAPERLSAMQFAIVRDPVRTGLFGFAGYVASVLLIVALAITLLGIPAAVALAVLLPIATYLGLAASATVIGAALPVDALRDRPVRQLAAGVGMLFVASVVPFLGTITVLAASCLGYGALLRTRFRTTPPRELMGDAPPGGDGPFRTASV